MTIRVIAMSGTILGVVTLPFVAPAGANDAADSFLATVHHQTTLTSTVPANGDQNPYAIVVAPVTAGKIKKGDVLVDNFNDKKNLQGLGTTIVDYDPATKKTTVFAEIPQKLAGCPGVSASLPR